MPVKPEDRSVLLRGVVHNEAFIEVMNEIERDAFDAFMRIPAWRRFGRQGQHWIRQIEAVREIRSRLDWIASNPPAPVRRVV